MGYPTPPVVPWRRADRHPLPRTLYFWFGEPIDPTGFAGQDDETAARALRDGVKRSVLAGIQFLRDERAKDPVRDPVKRLLRRSE